MSERSELERLRQTVNDLERERGEMNEALAEELRERDAARAEVERLKSSLILERDEHRDLRGKWTEALMRAEKAEADAAEKAAWLALPQYRRQELDTLRARVQELEEAGRRVLDWHRNNGGFDKDGKCRCDSENCEFDELSALLSAPAKTPDDHADEYFKAKDKGSRKLKTASAKEEPRHE